MRGEFIKVWSETRREIWDQLASQDMAHNDLYCELYRELSQALKKKPTSAEFIDTIGDPVWSKRAFESICSDDLAGERALAEFFERAYETLDELAGNALASSYFTLLATFVEKFNLRYDLQPPCT